MCMLSNMVLEPCSDSLCSFFVCHLGLRTKRLLVLRVHSWNWLLLSVVVPIETTNGVHLREGGYSDPNKVALAFLEVFEAGNAKAT